MAITTKVLSLTLAAISAACAIEPPAIPLPGNAFQFPPRPTNAAAPLVYEYSGDAAPDETFLLVGENLTTNLSMWGVSPNNPAGQAIKPRVQFLTNGCLAVTIPERVQDGPFVVWAKNQAGYSQPVVLNAPQPWWCGPDVAVPGQIVSLHGLNLARRPDFTRAFVCLARKGETGTWAKVITSGKYALEFLVPPDVQPGEYQVWVHAGNGGRWGWGGPVTLRVSSPRALAATTIKAGASGGDIQKALDAQAAQGGGVVKLEAGVYDFTTTVRVPANVVLAGAGKVATVLQLIHDPTATLPRISGASWNQVPGAVHTPGDTMEYELDVPQTGEWTVWLRYATDMSPWKQTGVSGKHTITADGGTPVPLMNLENTGSFGTFRWSKSALLKLTAGHHKLVWKNVGGGGASLDAFLLSLTPSFVPVDVVGLTNTPTRIVLQAEDCSRFVSKDGNLPGGDRAALWLTGNGAGVSDLAVLGNHQVNIGIAIRSTDPLAWLTNCQISRVRAADCDGKQGENCGILVRRADHAVIADNEIWGRAPLFISGAKQTRFASNRLVSVTRYGGNAEAAILGRTETIEQCVIADNLIASPPGAQSGGATARRLLWFSTGHGSITRNYIARNGVEPANGPGATLGAGQARFSGVAGTDQNVGEMILFEGNHRTMFFGRIVGAEPNSIILPKTVPPTPDDRLGNMDRKNLAHDAAGNETPFWPPDVDDGTDEPPIHEYYVSIMAGRGQGQTRRVLSRSGERLVVDRPWNVIPTNGCVVVIGTSFYQNHIINNYVPDGMTGIQLWISCMENIVAGNSIARQRKPGIFLYANGTTLASSMPRTWNRGVSPLFWNLIEGNRAEECSAGALLTSGDSPTLPVEFPRALGNVLRHNSFIRSRTDGVIITSRKPAASVTDTSPSIAGTIAEFNVVRDASIAYHAANSCDATVFRRNHAYFWYPVNNDTNRPVAFQVDNPSTTVAIEKNSIEGIHGVHDNRSVDLKLGPEIRRLPEK